MKQHQSIKQLILRHKGLLLFGIALATLTQFAAIALLGLSGWFISATAIAGLGTATALAFNYFLPSALVRAFAMTRIVSRYFERVISHDATFALLTELRLWLFQHLIKQPLKLRHQFKTGDLLARLLNDIDTLDQAYLRLISPAIVAVLVIVLITVVIAQFSPRLALATCALLSVAVFILPALIHVISRHWAKCLITLKANITQLSIDCHQGMAELILYGEAEQKLRELEQANRDLCQAQARLAMMQGLAQALVQTLLGISLILAIVMLAGAIISGTLSGADLALVLLTLLAGYEALAPLPQAFAHLGAAQLAASRVQQVSTKDTTESINEAKDFDSVELSIEQLHFRYHPNEPWVYKDLNLHVKQGERRIITGPTGSGKSSLLHCIAGIEQPSSGTIKLGGKSLTGVYPKHIRLMEQNPHLFYASVRENLSFGQTDISDTAMIKILELLRMGPWLKGLPYGLNSRIEEGGDNLSGGERKRIALARVLLNPAPIVLLDEPTEGMDDELAKEVIALIEKHLQDSTLIVVSHQKQRWARMEVEYITVHTAINQY